MDIDTKKLYITGFDRGTSAQKLKSLFPAAVDVQLPVRKSNSVPCGYVPRHLYTVSGVMMRINDQAWRGRDGNKGNINSPQPQQDSQVFYARQCGPKHGGLFIFFWPSRCKPGGLYESHRLDCHEHLPPPPHPH